MPYPFSEATIKETGIVQRVPWSATKSNAKMQAMRSAHKETLMARDAERGKAAGASVTNGRLDVLVDDGSGSWRVDPIASKIHHSGAELNDSFRKEWFAFCSRPQNEPNAQYPEYRYESKELRKQETQRVAVEIPQLDGGAPTQRPRGRPRKGAVGI
jgi:hypothetical protein